MSSAGSNWNLWKRQVTGIMRLEVKKNFLGRRALGVYLLAAVPVLIMMMLALFDRNPDELFYMPWIRKNGGVWTTPVLDIVELIDFVR